MTFHLVNADGGTLLASDTAVIKRAERSDFIDAVALLQAAAAIRDAAEVRAEAARQAAYEEALAEARGAVEAELAEQVAGFARALEQHEAARRDDIAAAAYAAVQAIVGTLDDETLVARIAERTLARLPDGPVTLHVAPVMAARLGAQLEELTHVTIVADPALGTTDCVLRGNAGQVIASLSVQLAALAKRWGVDG
jgi:flagellar biosynthesis/type III secretory pathway protein FliH